MKLMEINQIPEDPFAEPEPVQLDADKLSQRILHIHRDLDRARRNIYSYTVGAPQGSLQRMKTRHVPKADLVGFKDSIAFDSKHMTYYDARFISDIKHLEHLYNKMYVIERRYIKAKEALATAQARAKMASRQANPSKRSNTDVPDAATIPIKLRAGGSLFGNPYHKAGPGETPFAGAPSSFPFTSTQVHILNTLNAALSRNGIPTMSVCYATNSKPPVECAVINGDGRVAWRKFGLSNVVMFNGHKMNSSVFVSMSPAAQDAILQAM